MRTTTELETQMCLESQAFTIVWAIGVSFFWSFIIIITNQLYTGNYDDDDEVSMMITGLNNAERVAWALGEYFFSVIFYY